MTEQEQIQIEKPKKKTYTDVLIEKSKKASIEKKEEVLPTQPKLKKKSVKIAPFFSPYEKVTSRKRHKIYPVRVRPGFFGSRSLVYPARQKRMTHLQVLRQQQKKLILQMKIKDLKERLRPSPQLIAMQQLQMQQQLPPPMPLYPWENEVLDTINTADIGHGDKSLWGNEAWFGGEDYFGEDFFGHEDFSLQALGINIDRRLPSPLLY